jgi:2-methylcitrate dehydratase PrpD
LPDPLRNLCRFIGDTDLQDIPSHVIDHAKRVLMDTLGVMVAGSKLREVERMAESLAKSRPETQGVTCPGRPETFDLLHGALINGMAGSSLEYEEGNSRALGHPAILDLDILTDDLIHNPEIVRLAEKVEMIHSPDYENRRPAKNPARVTIRLRNGREFSHEILDCLGDVSNPLPAEKITQKFYSLAIPVIGRERADRFVDGMVRLGNQDRIRSLIKALRHRKEPATL